MKEIEEKEEELKQLTSNYFYLESQRSPVASQLMLMIEKQQEISTMIYNSYLKKLYIEEGCSYASNDKNQK